MKICCTCKESKSPIEFYNDKQKKDGKLSRCISCHKIAIKLNYKNNKQTRKRYSEKNLEKLMFHNAKNRAKRFNLEFDIIEEDLVVPKKCPVLGLKLMRANGFRSWNSPSLDRIDNSKGYTKANVKIISWRANHLKSHASLSELKNLVNYMEDNTNA